MTPFEQLAEAEVVARATVLFNSTSSIDPDLTRSYIIQKSKGRAKVVMHGVTDARFDVIDSSVADINVH
ncbi:MAG: hypothetical protein ACHP7C_10600, partial [Lysobacterales bacterium]